MIEKILTISFAMFSALRLVTGTAKRYFVKTSLPLRTYLYTGELNVPTRSICNISPEKD